MHSALADAPGHDLHGFGMGPIGADALSPGTAAQQHAVPGEQHGLREWLVVPSIEVDHHLDDATLGLRHPTIVPAETELPA